MKTINIGHAIINSLKSQTYFVILIYKLYLFWPIICFKLASLDGAIIISYDPFTKTLLNRLKILYFRRKYIKAST